MQIAIDGPAGAGKSSISKAVAGEMGYLYIDTGAMYRAVGLAALEGGVDFADGEALTALAREADIKLTIEPDGQHIFMNGQDVTGKIRTPSVSMAASAVSAIGGVRKALVDIQRQIAGNNDVIMDGRDIGTVVLPKAEVKIYLTASVEARAERRAAEMREKGEDVDFDEVKRDIEKRDHSDTHRKESPLRRADDAVLLDTSELNFEESVDAVKGIIGRAGND